MGSFPETYNDLLIRAKFSLVVLNNLRYSMFHDCIPTIVNFADHNFDYTQLFKAKDIFICMLLNLLLYFHILLDF